MYDERVKGSLVVALRFSLIILLSFFVVGFMGLWFGVIGPLATNVPYLSNVFNTVNFLSNNRITINPGMGTYQLKMVNKTYLNDYAARMGFFSKDGYTLPAAQFAPPSVPKESLHNTIGRMVITFNVDLQFISENLKDEAIIFPARASLGDKHILEITINIPEDLLNALTKKVLEKEAFELKLNTEILFSLSRLSGKYSEDELAFLHGQLKEECVRLAIQKKLPIVIR